VSDKLWKALERYYAKALGGERVPVNSTTNVKCDVATQCFSVEIKERKELPVFLKDCMDQAVTNCEVGKTPLVILHEKGKRHDSDFVVMRAGDFIDWHGGL